MCSRNTSARARRSDNQTAISTSLDRCCCLPGVWLGSARLRARRKKMALPTLPFVARVAAESPEFGEAVERVHDLTYAPGALDAKTKILITLALDIAWGEAKGTE